MADDLMEKIKIMYVVNSLDSGLGRNTVNLLKNMSDEYQYVVCCIQGAGEYARELSGKAKIIVFRKGKGKGVGFPLKLSKIFKKEKICIVHAHNTDPLQQAIPAALLARVPIILYTDHNTLATKQKKLVLLYNRFLARFCDKIITVSKSVRRELAREWKIPESKIVAIQNGADFSFVLEKTKKTNARKKTKELGLKQADKTIFTLGNFRVEKNLKTLVEAMPLILQREPRAFLLLAGKGEMEKELCLLVKKLKIGKRVKFLGQRKDALEIMKIADIFAICSSSEALPQSLLEAMSLGKAIVASNIPGISEAISNGRHGLLVQKDSPKEFARAIVQLLESKALAAKLGRNARELARKKFNIILTAKKQESLYKNIIKQKK